MMATVILIAIAATIFVHHHTLDVIQQHENQAADDAILREVDQIRARTDEVKQIAGLLASSPEFRTPADEKLDLERLETLPIGSARKIVYYDKVLTWLPTESGPSSPLGTVRRGQRLIMWQLTRGLSLRSPDGHLLARSRRSLAKATIAAHPDLVDIAEIDATGRIVFMEPYGSQTRLAAFNLSTLLPSIGANLDSPHWEMALHAGLLPDEGSKFVSFVVSARRATGLYNILLSLPREIRRSSNGDHLSVGLFSPAHELLMCTGDAQPLIRAEQNTRASRRVSVPIGLDSYTAVMSSAESPASASLTRASTYMVLIEITLFALFSVVIGTALAWVSSVQWKLANVQKQVQKRAQDLAHDFQNRILALKTLMGNVSRQLELDQLQRLGGAIDDLGGYTDQLSTRLVPEAFALSDVPGALNQDVGKPATYLRGTIETVAQQQAAILKHKIPIEFAADSGPEPFVAITRPALTRILSNLIGNSIEACAAVIGSFNVSVSVFPDGDDVRIRIADNGCGIEEQVQKQIFKPGFSTKGAGRGKGLANCTELAHASGATVTLVASEPDKGTIMELRVRRSPTPGWFVNSITLTGQTVLVVVDDEGDALEYWQKAITSWLSEINLPPDLMPRLMSIRGPSELMENKDNVLQLGTMFLVDYEFKDEAMTGIELIQLLGLERKAILVTNHFEQPDVLQAVERFGLRLLPKTYMLNAKFPIDIQGAV